MAEKTFSTQSSIPLRTRFSTSDLAFYQSMAQLPRDARELQAQQKLVRELRRAETGLRAAVLERLQAWTQLSHEEGTAVATAFDAALDHLTPAQQEEIFAAEREVIVNGLTFRQFEALSQFVPWLRSWYVPRPERGPVNGVPAPIAAALALAG